MYSRNTCGKFVISVFFLIGLLILAYSTVSAGNAQPSKVYGVAIDGYDPVAYFTESRPVKGSSEYSYTWNQAQWHFANPQHREMFANNPEKYTPKRSGF